MKLRILISAGLALVSLCLSAQSLPKLGRADEVSTGMLPNGITYYLVTNPVTKGRADFALVQEGVRDTLSTREALSALAHIRPADFLERKAVPYTRDGYVKIDDGGRVFHFHDVDISNSATRDSTLLMLTDLMTLSPWSQTVIVSGDISKDVFSTALHTLSLMVPHVKPLPREADKGESSLVQDSAEENGGLMDFRINRVSVSPEQAGTAVPLVSELLERELAYIFRDRVLREMRYLDIPCHISRTPDRIRIYTPDSLEKRASAAVRDILADISAGRVSQAEFLKAKNIALSNIIDTGLEPGKSNAFYVERCVSAARFGTHLASQATIENFFSKRKITPERELELFCNFAKALIGQVQTDGPKPEMRAETYAISDEVLRIRPGKAPKLSASTTDPVSGGELWTFDNRIRVIYKQDKTAGGVHFCFAARGGASSLKDVRAGESAYLSDMLFTSRIAGMDGYDFLQMLSSEGIHIENSVTLEDMRIYGSAKSENIDKVLKALLKIGYEREVDMEAFDYFRKCEILRSEVELPPVYEVMDSLMCPDYMFLPSASPYNMRDDLPLRADEYFNSRFGNVADGVFVFVGNIDSEELKSVLGKYLGKFRTSRSYALREKVRYNLHSRRNTYIVRGDDRSVNMAATALVTSSRENYFAFRIAQKAVEDHFSKSLSQIGMYALVEGRMDLSPVEKVTLYVTCRPCDPSGLPAGISPSGRAGSLHEIRRIFSELPYMSISDESLKGYKAIVSGDIARELSTPDGIIRYCLNRYSEGRDLTSGYANAISAITADDVRQILEELTASGVVEYIVDNE